MTDAIELAAVRVNKARAELDAAEQQLFALLAADRVTGRPPRRSAACGTPSGYNAHTRNYEPPCAACTAALRWHSRHYRHGTLPGSDRRAVKRQADG